MLINSLTVQEVSLDELEGPGWRVEPPAKGLSREERRPARAKSEIQKSKRNPICHTEGREMEKLTGWTPEETTRKEIQRGDHVIPLVGYISGEDVFIESVMNKVPISHTEGLESISVSYNPVFAGKIPAAAKYQPAEKRIVLGRIEKFWNIRDTEPARKYSERTLFHEIGHHVNNIVSDKEKQEIIKAAEEDHLILLNKKKADAGEYFAEAYRRWYDATEREELENRHPKVYTILEKLFRREI